MNEIAAMNDQSFVGLQSFEAQRVSGMSVGVPGTLDAWQKALDEYGTEAGLFQGVGWSAVVCGPGDIAQAHQPDEYIEIAELEAGERLLRRLNADLCR